MDLTASHNYRVSQHPRQIYLSSNKCLDILKDAGITAVSWFIVPRMIIFMLASLGIV